MTQCYLGLGSNLQAPKRQLRQAIASLRKLPHSTITGQSSIYLSKPLGVRAQPSYYNMVVSIHTLLPPKRLLHHCQLIEKKQQRICKRHWGARTIDIDILLYGNKAINLNELTIPHPHMLTRDFVLIPLVEIAPFSRLPNGQLINTYLMSCKKYCNSNTSLILPHCINYTDKTRQ